MRYLTPAKISLLVLIEVYIDGAVPNDAAVQVLSFLSSHILDLHPQSSPKTQQTRWSQAQSRVSLFNSLDEFEKLLSSHGAANGLPGRRLWDYFLNKLWAINYLDKLHYTFERLGQHLTTTREQVKKAGEDGTPTDQSVKLSQNSPFGSFVRSCLIEFDRLQFSDITKLWQDFVKYRQPTFETWSRRHPNEGQLCFDLVLRDGEHEWGHRTEAIATITYGDLLGDHCQHISADELEQLLEFQARQLEKYGHYVPTELRQQFSEILDGSGDALRLANYLKCLEAWRAGDYTTSFDYLHRYFDYTMHNKDKSFYQYALLNLAVLQADFGCNKEALNAMLETISTARENRDMTCLNYATSWLYSFGLKHPALVRNLDADNMLGSGKEALVYLRSKAKESGMWTLWSKTLLCEAHAALSGGGSISSALEYMTRSSQVMVEHNNRIVCGSQALMSIALWDRTGVACLSSMKAQVFRRCHVDDSSTDDVLKIMCRLSGQLATRGRFDEALSLMDNMDKSTIQLWKEKEYHDKYRTIIKVRRALHRQDLDYADYTISQLLQANLEDLDPDLKIMVDTFHIEALRRRGDFTAAFTKIEQLLEAATQEDKDLTLRVRLFLAKANLFDAVGRPQRGFSIAMRAASIAYRARFMPLLWQSIGAVANILNWMGDFNAAMSLMDAVIPRSLECEGAYLTGVLYSVLADAHVGLAGEAKPIDKNKTLAGEGGGGGRETRHQQRHGGSSRGKNNKLPNKRAEHLVKASDAFEQAIKHFKAVEEVEKQLEMLAKKATIMNVLGDAKVANDYAARYLELRRDSRVEVSAA